MPQELAKRCWLPWQLCGIGPEISHAHAAQRTAPACAAVLTQPGFDAASLLVETEGPAQTIGTVASLASSACHLLQTMGGGGEVSKPTTYCGRTVPW